MPAGQKIAVVGATGRVGRPTAELLTQRGYDVVPISRAQGVDVITGDGLAAALDQVQCVIDAATGPSPEQEPATAFFTTAARNLQEAGQRAGVRQIITVSIIGTDLTRGGYGLAKMAHERTTLAGPVPATVLRAAQFHEFIGQLVEWGTQGQVSYLPKMRIQPVAARAVAEVLAGLASDAVAADRTGADAGQVLEVAGPRPENLVDLATLLVSRRGGPVKIEGVSDPANPDREIFENGSMLPGPGAILTGPTFEDWLEASP